MTSLHCARGPGSGPGERGGRGARGRAAGEVLDEQAGADERADRERDAIEVPGVDRAELGGELVVRRIEERVARAAPAGDPADAERERREIDAPAGGQALTDRKSVVEG